MKFTREMLWDIDLIEDDPEYGDYIVTGAPEMYSFDKKDKEKVEKWMKEIVTEAEDYWEARTSYHEDFPEFLKRVID